MNKLENLITIVLQRIKAEQTVRKWDTKRCCFNRMLKLANSMCVDEPCQKLYNAFEAQGKYSREKLNLNISCIRLLDAAAGTKAVDMHGVLYNVEALPEEHDVIKYFRDKQLPFTTGISIDYLIVKADYEIAYLALSTSTIGQYRHAWTDIRRHFIKNDAADYNELLMKEYLLAIESQFKSGNMKFWKWKINRKATHVLMEVAYTGRFQWKSIRTTTNSLSDEIASVYNQYLSSLESRNLNSSTISLHDYVFRNTMVFIRVNDILSLSSIGIDDIQNVIVEFSSICNVQSMSTITRSLRSLLRFLYAAGYVKKDLSGIVMPAYKHRGSVAEYISKRDQKKLEANLDNISRRDKAVALLAIKLGLRDCDICGLTFQQIDWYKDKIIINQKKTGEPLVLPLLPAVGNALMDYIMNERPIRHDRYPYIFLRKQAPYRKLSSVYAVFSKLLKVNGITPVNGTSSGANVFRYTMVYRMLLAKVPHQVITDALGHKSKETDKPYISMEESMLRKCALDLSIVGSISWERGGCN